jgi:hypothetical protein
MAEERAYPFHCGSQYGDWVARNCTGCRLFDAEEFKGRCDIDGALGDALADDGSVSTEIGRRMGLPGNELAYTWDCPERQPGCYRCRPGEFSPEDGPCTACAKVAAGVPR